MSESVEAVRDSVSDAAAGAAAAIGGATSGFAPREERRDYGGRDGGRQPYEGRGGDRGGRSFGGDRGGRGGYGADRGRAPQTGGFRAPPDRVLTPTNGIYIGNLLFDVTAQDITREFEQFGTIKSSVIATDARGLSKG